MTTMDDGDRDNATAHWRWSNVILHSSIQTKNALIFNNASYGADYSILYEEDPKIHWHKQGAIACNNENGSHTKSFVHF